MQTHTARTEIFGIDSSQQNEIKDIPHSAAQYDVFIDFKDKPRQEHENAFT